VAKTRRVWRYSRRGMVNRLLRTLNSLMAQDDKERAKKAADPDYTPLYFVTDQDVNEAVLLLQNEAKADLAARA
jgi:hypothetical protein